MNFNEQILKAIEGTDKILILRHLRPDSDALGSQRGLAEILKASYPNKTVVMQGKKQEGLKFIAEMDNDALSDESFLVFAQDTANIT